MNPGFLRRHHRRLLATSCLLGFALLLAEVAPAQLLVEHFSYGNGNLGASGIGNTSWTGGDSPSAAITVNSNAALTYSGLVGATGNGVVFSGGTFKKIAAPFAAQSGNGTTVYVSFLLSGVVSGNTEKLLVYLQNANSASSSPPLGIFLFGTQIGLAKSASTPPARVTLSAGTHLIVARYSFLASNDQVDLWVDPTSLGTNAIPSATLTTGTSSSSDASALGHVFLNHGVNQTIWLDELRVGTSWADVTPAGNTAPPATNTVPRFTQAFMSSAGLVLRGTNGPANGAFDLLATPDVATPLSQWAEVASDNFTASGQFDLTNPVSPAVAQQFFRLRVGNSTPVAVAPQITTQPTNLTVLASQTATFNVVASGTSPLSYQWYFNTNTPLSGQTSATFALSNVQTNNAGGYSVVVTNIAGSVTSIVATLTVSNILAPPGITTQPQSQTVTEGQTAVFNVVATGTPVLNYQWFFNTNTTLVNQTNASLTLNTVSSNDAGAYSVTVTNNYGATNSLFVTLTVNPPSTNNIDFSHVGFGNVGFTVTGGAGGPTVYVGSEAELQLYGDANPAYIIYVTNSFGLSGMSTHIRPNKTVIGTNNAVLSGGGLYLYRSTNVIIRNLTIRDSTEDNIGLHYSANVWIDHCTLSDSTDGNIDLTQETDNVTISWCKFHYTVNNGHNFVNLLGASDGENSIGKLHVTFHHNWWSIGCVERLPSVRFGRAHVYNNYYNAPGNNYCVRTRLYAESRIENNWFENVKNPWEIYITSGTQGKVFVSGNSLLNTTSSGNGVDVIIPPGTDSVFAPPYSYMLDAASAIPNIVTNNAGVGKGPFAP